MPADETTVAQAVGLCKSFGPRHVLDRLSFTLRRGQMLGLVGANGGGKTTTLRVLAGLAKPDDGTVRVFGRDPRRLTTADRRRIGYMSQSHALYPDLTLSENLRFRAALLDGPIEAAVSDVARYCGIEHLLAERIAHLSGGWARRAQFAALLVGRPALLLLDEPTSGLDILTRRTMWGWMRSLADAGHAIVISTHDLVDAESCSDVMYYTAQGVTGPMKPSSLAAMHDAPDLETLVAASTVQRV